MTGSLLTRGILLISEFGLTTAIGSSMGGTNLKGAHAVV